MSRLKTHASFAGFGLVTCAVVALAQNPPPDTTPRPSTPPSPPSRAEPPTRTPPPAQRPATDASTGYMATPKYAQALNATLSENAIQIFADNEFKGDQTTLEGVMKMHQPGTLNTLPEGYDNGVTSLRWNLEPGTLVVLFEDDTGKGQQLALWGKGQIPDLALVDFNETASRWAWYDVGGGAHARSPGNIQLPHGSQTSDGSVAEGSIQMFDDQNFADEMQTVSGISGIKAGDWHTITTVREAEKENSASSLRWNLPEGVVVILAAEDGGNDNIILFGEGQNPDLGQCDFDNKASRWSWAYIGGTGKDMKPRDPNAPRNPNAPRQPTTPSTPPSNPGSPREP